MNKTGIISALLLLSSPIYAQETTNPISISATAGYGHHKIDASGGYEDESGNDFSTSFAVNYQINNAFSASIAYTDYGQADLFEFNSMEVVDGNNVFYKATLQSETSAISAYATYASEREVGEWSYSASLGLARWSTDLDFDINIQNFNVDSRFTATSEDGIAVIGGLGATYSATEAIDIDIRFNWFVNDLDIDLIANETVDMQHGHYGLGVTYRF